MEEEYNHEIWPSSSDRYVRPSTTGRQTPHLCRVQAPSPPVHRSTAIPLPLSPIWSTNAHRPLPSPSVPTPSSTKQQQCPPASPKAVFRPTSRSHVFNPPPCPSVFASKMTSKTVMDALPTTTDIRLRGNHEAPNYLGSTGIAITPPLTPDCDNSQYNRSDAVVSPEDCEPARVATAQADPDRRTKRRLLGDSKQVHTVPARQIEVVTTSLSEPYMAHVEEPVIVATSMYGQAGERDRAINAAMPDVKKLPSDMAGGSSSTRSGQTKSLSTMIGYFPASPHLPSHLDPPVALATTFPSLQRRGAVRGATGVRFASAKRNGATLGELSGSVTTSSTGGLTRTAGTSWTSG